METKRFSTVALADEIGKKICQVCGVDPKLVGSVMIDLSAGEVANIVFQVYAPGEIEELDIETLFGEVKEAGNE